MFNIKIKIILAFLLLYQSPLLSKSTSLDKFNAKNLSNYFSGIVAFENKKNSKALNYFNSSKILMQKHDPYLEKYTRSLVLDFKVSNAINIIKMNKENNNSNFFEAYILLTLDSLKNNNLEGALKYLSIIPEFLKEDRFNSIIVKSLEEYTYVFKEKKILENKQNFGNLSLISETFQRCYLKDSNTDTYFSKLINISEANYSRYIYFYLSFMVENNLFDKVKNITNELDYVNTTLLLSQGKNWIENNNVKKFNKIFSCRNHNDILGEFLFLISNLYSSQNNLEKSNFYLVLSNYLNPKFVFNLSLIIENFYLNEDYENARKLLKNYTQEHDFYYWYRLKTEAKIISKLKSKEEALNFIIKKFSKIKNVNDKMKFDVANFYKNSEKYEIAINLYSQILENLRESSEARADILYRKGASYERLKKYEKADKDLIEALEINPNDAYILNYLAYSWLERDYQIDKAIEMLENAYKIENNNPYIIDSIGWAYYLIENFEKAEIFLKKAVELMPEDPIVNDHYGDILWKLNKKIQARYFWSSVMKMENTEQELIDKITNKLIYGLKS